MRPIYSLAGVACLSTGIQALPRNKHEDDAKAAFDAALDSAFYQSIEETPHEKCFKETQSRLEDDGKYGIDMNMLNHDFGNWVCMVDEWTEEAQRLGVGRPNVDRGLTKSSLGLLNQYGCWCYFEDEYTGGSGPTQDELDIICKTLSQGYDCISMEYGCTPYQEPYNSAFGTGLAPFGLTKENLVAECDMQNTPDSCAAATCIVEGWFILSYFTWSVFGGAMVDGNMVSKGFDHDDTCLGRSGVAPGTTVTPGSGEGGEGANGGNAGAESPIFGGTTMQPPSNHCCGNYPDIFPYSDLGGGRDCCGYATFMTDIMECCPGNDLQSIGSC